MTYLVYGAENSSSKIQKVNVSSTLCVVVINAINDETVRIVDGATVRVENEWFHPEGVCVWSIGGAARESGFLLFRVNLRHLSRIRRKENARRRSGWFQVEGFNHYYIPIHYQLGQTLKPPFHCTPTQKIISTFHFSQ